MTRALSATGVGRSAAAPRRPAHADFELAKLVALVAMAVDHYGKIVDFDAFEPTNLVGRLALPLFAGIVGARLALDPDLGPRYLRSLLLWAVVSQPVYVLCGRDWLDGNILFTLALGVAAAMVLRGGSARPLLSTTAMLVGILAASVLVDYGPLGIAIVPAVAFAARRFGTAGLWFAGAAGLAANAVWSLPPLEASDLAALAAGPLLAATVALRFRLPRLPAAFFYAFYPGHLLALHLWDLWPG